MIPSCVARTLSLSADGVLESLLSCDSTLFLAAKRFIIINSLVLIYEFLARGGGGDSAMFYTGGSIPSSNPPFFDKKGTPFT